MAPNRALGFSRQAAFAPNHPALSPCGLVCRLLSHKSQHLTRPAWSPRTARIGPYGSRSTVAVILSRSARGAQIAYPKGLTRFRLRSIGSGSFPFGFCPPNRPALAGQLASARLTPVVACQGRVLTFGCGPHHPCPATIDSPGQARGSGCALSHSVPPETCVSGHRLAEA